MAVLQPLLSISTDEVPATFWSRPFALVFGQIILMTKTQFFPLRSPVGRFYPLILVLVPRNMEPTHVHIHTPRHIVEDLKQNHSATNTMEWSKLQHKYNTAQQILFPLSFS